MISLPMARLARAAIRMLQNADVHKLLVVGSWPSLLVELRQALKDRFVELRTIDGRSGPRPVASVEKDLSWADVLVIWSGTPVDHSVSAPYTSRAREGKFRTQIVTVKGGVEAVCRALQVHARRRRSADQTALCRAS